MKSLFVHFFLFILFITAAFLVQQFIYFGLQISLYNELVISYSTNIGVYALIVILYFLIKKKLQDKPHILYYLTIIIKLLLVFIVFIPLFKQDGKISKPEFITFFIPYAICLLFTVLFLIGRLKLNEK